MTYTPSPLQPRFPSQTPTPRKPGTVRQPSATLETHREEPLLPRSGDDPDVAREDGDDEPREASVPSGGGTCDAPRAGRRRTAGGMATLAVLTRLCSLAFLVVLLMWIAQ